jgi:hypothetical protein
MVAALGLLALIPAAFAEDAGLDWKQVSAADSQVRITLPELAGQARYFTAQTEGYSATLYIARVTTDSFRADRALAIYVELSPGRFFPTTTDVGDILDWKPFKEVGLVEAERFTTVAGGGRYDVATFKIEGDVSCAAFARTWGSHGSMTAGAGSRRITGYGCQDRGKPLSRERIKEALDSLEIDDD